MKKQPKILVIGSFMVDLMSKSPHLPKPGQTVMGGPFHMGAGGKGSNQAIAAAKLGAEVEMVVSSALTNSAIWPLMPWSSRRGDRGSQACQRRIHRDRPDYRG